MVLEISSLSYYDTVCIIAHYHNKNSGIKRTTITDLKNRGYTDEVIKALESKPESFKPLTTCGITFKSDFSHLEYPFFEYIKTLYDAYDKGMLPFPGTTSDQPAQIMQIFLTLGNLYAETRELQRIQQEQANKARNKRR